MTDLTVIETGEVIEQMTRVEAERITARIADKLDAIADNLEQVLPLIGEALTRRAWESLGYVSPQAYVSERFAGSLARLSPDVRRPVVAQLSAAGMSTRQIAPVVGVSVATAKRDAQVAHREPPAPTPTKLPESPVIVGADGKNYQRPAPQPPANQEEDAQPMTATAQRPRQTSSGPRKKDLPVLQNVVRGIGVYLIPLNDAITHGFDDSVTSEEASAASADLSRHLAALNKLNRQLKNRQEQS